MEMGVHQYALVPFMRRPLDIVVNAMAVPRHRAEAEELSHARMQFDIRKSVANVHLHKCSTAKAEPSRFDDCGCRARCSRRRSRAPKSRISTGLIGRPCLPPARRVPPPTPRSEERRVGKECGSTV